MKFPFRQSTSTGIAPPILIRYAIRCGIYFVLFRFYLSSIIAACIDMVGFSLAMWLTGNVAVSVVAGRLSSIANFALNKRFVFNSSAPIKGALVRYYLLVLLIGIASYGGIRALKDVLGWNVFAAKVTVETLLSLVSFSMQRTFVFGRRSGPALSIHPERGAAVKKKHALLLLLVLCAVTAAYWNHFGNSFHFDDTHTVVGNAYIRDLRNIPSFFTDGNRFSVLPANRTYRPVVSATLAIDYWLNHHWAIRDNAQFWFHLSTFFWLLVQLVATYALFARIFDAVSPKSPNAYIALLATAWYGLHPRMRRRSTTSFNAATFTVPLVSWSAWHCSRVCQTGEGQGSIFCPSQSDSWQSRQRWSSRFCFLSTSSTSRSRHSRRISGTYCVRSGRHGRSR